MKEKSIYNMVVAILAGILLIPFLVLGIIFTKNPLSIIFMCIYYPLLMAHFVMKALDYGKDESSSKEVCYRLSRVFLMGAITLIGIQFTLQLSESWKWIVFAFLCAAGVGEIIIESLQKGIEWNVLFIGLELFLWIWLLSNLYTFHFSVLLGIVAPVVGYFSHIVGKTLENKIVLSFDIISVILFGLSIIFI